MVCGEWKDKLKLVLEAIDEMVEYYKGDEAKLALELRWMGIVIRRVKTLPREDKHETQVAVNPDFESF